MIARLLAAAALAAAASPVLAATPEEVFLESCSACHQAEGTGIPGAFPALKASPFVLGPSDQVIAAVLNGRGGMPAFKDELTDEQLAGAISYIRGAWGNRGKPVSPAEVLKGRSDPAGPKPKNLQAH